MGEQPDAAETLGVDVARYRIVTVLVAGALAGLAGAQLSLGVGQRFRRGHERGARMDRRRRGDAGAQQSRSTPPRPASLFGFADAVSISLQSQGLPNQLTDISPYVATLAALVISHGRRIRAARRPAEAAAGTSGQTATPPP